jgi:anti-sigma regulatory factor (Ser/Thr protein kinase)
MTKDKHRSPSCTTEDSAWDTLAEFSLPSEAGNEREAVRRVAELVGPLGLGPARTERLKTAVAEATLNAIEHGNRFRADLPVAIRVVTSKAGRALAVAVTDQGTSGPLPERVVPDLSAKLAGQQSPRGWGFFLIEKMVDDLRVTSDDAHHTIELFLYLEGEE